MLSYDRPGSLARWIIASGNITRENVGRTVMFKKTYKPAHIPFTIRPRAGSGLTVKRSFTGLSPA